MAWEVQNFPGGPVWHESKITNEEMQFMTPLGEQMKDEEEIGKYGQVVKVMTEQRPWKHILGQTGSNTEAKKGQDEEERHVSEPNCVQAKFYDEMWDDRSQKWYQMGTWKASPQEEEKPNGEAIPNSDTWVRDTWPKVVREYKNGKTMHVT